MKNHINEQCGRSTHLALSGWQKAVSRSCERAIRKRSNKTSTRVFTILNYCMWTTILLSSSLHRQASAHHGWVCVGRAERKVHQVQPVVTCACGNRWGVAHQLGKKGTARFCKFYLTQFWRVQSGMDNPIQDGQQGKTVCRLGQSDDFSKEVEIDALQKRGAVGRLGQSDDLSKEVEIDILQKRRTVSRLGPTDDLSKEVEIDALEKNTDVDPVSL
jgi:hypothetical protein